MDNIHHGHSRTVKAETLLAILGHKDELDDLARPEPKRSYKDTLSAKLSDWEVAEAYARHKAGATIKELAEQYGVSAKNLPRLLARFEKRREAKPCKA